MPRKWGMRFLCECSELFRQSLAKEAQRIFKENRVDIFTRVSALFEDIFKLVDVGNCVEIARRLFVAKPAIKIGPDRAMRRIASDLANVINVICRRFDSDNFRLRDATLPAGIKHPRIKHGADDRLACDEYPNLFIRKLAIAWNQGATIVMAGEHGAFINVHRLEKRCVRQMSSIKN